VQVKYATVVIVHDTCGNLATNWVPFASNFGNHELKAIHKGPRSQAQLHHRSRRLRSFRITPRHSDIQRQTQVFLAHYHGRLKSWLEHGEQTDHEGNVLFNDSQSRPTALPRLIAMAQEFAGISADPPPGCDIKLAQEGDLHLWDVYMDGPADSPYKVRLSSRSICCTQISKK
jgi:hypothetical protein